MELEDAILGRRSVHEYKQELVPEGVLEGIFTKASWAPTHHMKEPWNIYMYQGAGVKMYADNVLRSYERQGFFSGYKEDRQTKVREGIRDFLLRIPHHALIYMEKDPDKRKYDEDYAAVCAYIQNVQLLAWESGVGVLWTTNPYLYDSEFVRDIGLDPHIHRLVSVLQMGYPARVPKPKLRTEIGKKLSIIDR
ncbi:nitroreductase [Bacillus sp. SB49]|uniref:nitroreductase family protein n=1 Tax=Bacillaceae TaxID=186817 RepID=UPI0002A51522|nr:MULTISPECIES: nitroreductase [Bacillaceae]ELK47995.1 putative nitroreductase family protein [Halobacillus sp. BAB-2008]QHT47595.1 nitroreductase [Bacillus sp. SB49]